MIEFGTINAVSTSLYKQGRAAKLQQKNNWRWTTGKVSRSDEHMEIRFGSADLSEWDHWIPVALVGAPKGHTFTVEFLLAPGASNEHQAIEAVKRELNFYLIEKGEENPWSYAQYHCGTASNWYSDVNWGFFEAKAD